MFLPHCLSALRCISTIILILKVTPDINTFTPLCTAFLCERWWDSGQPLLAPDPTPNSDCVLLLHLVSM